MLLVTPNVHDAAVHAGVQRLDASVHHFGKARVLGDVGHRQARRPHGVGRAARGEELDMFGGEGGGELHQTGLVGHGEERAGDLHFVHSCPWIQFERGRTISVLLSLVGWSVRVQYSGSVPVGNNVCCVLNDATKICCGKILFVFLTNVICSCVAKECF